MAVVDSFIKIVTDKANQPVYIRCGSANRVAGLWMAKRMLVDKWTEEKAPEEAKAIGLSNEALRQFALDYVEARQEVNADPLPSPGRGSESGGASPNVQAHAPGFCQLQ